MAKGQEAKDRVIAVLKDAFGDNFVGEFDKKIYVWSEEGGQPQQVAMSLTCPKTVIGIDRSGAGDFLNVVSTGASSTKVDMTQEEQDTIQELMQKLGL